MSRRRVYASSDSQAGLYHVTSRIVDRQFLLREVERNAFVRMMRAFEAFHHVEVLTYCVMGNHFHLLVRVPQRPAGFDLSAEQVMALLAPAVGPGWRRLLRRQWGTAGSEAVERWRQRSLARMFSLTDFIKSLKQRFTQYYNRRHDRDGVLWERRYTSVIIEDAARALRTVATYIDLNPVRAGITGDPGMYRWCGYADALRGGRNAIRGLAKITGHAGENMSFGMASAKPGSMKAEMNRIRRGRIVVAYRALLGVAGRERRTADGRVVRRGLHKEVLRRWDEARGVRLDALNCRIIHFTRGVVIGSRRYVNDWFERNRWWFGGSSRQKRKTGARAIGPPSLLPELYSIRNLNRQSRR